MSVGDLASVIIAATAFIGLLIAGVAWFYKRGGQEAEMVVALKTNTTATTELTKRFDSFMERTQDRQDGLDRRVNEHETRITVSERDINELQRRDMQQRLDKIKAGDS